MSMEETIMFVANLKKNTGWKNGETLLLGRDVPEEEENEVSKFSPTSTNDLEPGISVWGIEFKFGGKLMGSPCV